MKHRNPFMVLLLSIITFGIYDLYWLVKTKTVLNKQTKVHTPTVWLLFLPVLIFIALIIVALIVGVHQAPTIQPITTTGNNYATMQETKNSAGFTVVILLFDLVAFVVIIPITFYWFFKFSKAINDYTNSELNTGVTFLLLWLLHFIGVIIVQDKFNDMLEAGTISSDGTAMFAHAGPPAPGMNSAVQPAVMPSVAPIDNPIVPATPIAPQPSIPTGEPVVSATVPAAPSEPDSHAQDNDDAPPVQPQKTDNEPQDHSAEIEQSTPHAQNEDDSGSVDSPTREQNQSDDEENEPPDSHSDPQG
jgi:hypothetical protein